MRRSLPLVLILAALNLNAQNSPDASPALQQILNRLDALEKQNQELVQEVRQLRQQIAGEPSTQATAPPNPGSAATAPTGASQPSLDERLSVEERRTAEQAQTKVEAANKFPIQLNGMLLFNAFANRGTSANILTSDAYGFLTGPGQSGATLRQTILGLQFQGPRLPGDGRVHGSLSMDFWGGSSDPQLNWRSPAARGHFTGVGKSSLSFGQDKPLIAPYQPDSLAQVGIPPLAGAGNLWLWLPQVRYEERIHFGNASGLTGQVALLQTKETAAIVRRSFADSLEPSDPPSKPASPSGTNLTTRAASKSLLVFTSAPRMLPALPSIPALAHSIGSSSPGRILNSVEPFSKGKMSRLLELWGTDSPSTAIEM